MHLVKKLSLKIQNGFSPPYVAVQGRSTSCLRSLCKHTGELVLGLQCNHL